MVESQVQVDVRALNGAAMQSDDPALDAAQVLAAAGRGGQYQPVARECAHARHGEWYLPLT
jgi:hypothetical protein